MFPTQPLPTDPEHSLGHYTPKSASLYLSNCQLLPWDHGWPFIQGSLKLSVRIEYLCGLCVNISRDFYFLMKQSGDSIMLCKKTWWNKVATKSLADDIKVTMRSDIRFLKKTFVLHWGRSGPCLWENSLWTKTEHSDTSWRNPIIHNMIKGGKIPPIRTYKLWTWIFDQLCFILI